MKSNFITSDERSVFGQGLGFILASFLNAFVLHQVILVIGAFVVDWVRK